MKLLALVALVFSFTSAHAQLKEFKTDYCTFYPNGSLFNRNAWKHCCLEHDIYYWVGGSKKRQFSVDLKLRECVRSTGYDLIANMMYYGVRAGHYSPVKIKYDWGWGRVERDKFAPLLLKEELALKKLLLKYKL